MVAHRQTNFAITFMALALASGGWAAASEEEFLEYREIRVVGQERKDTGKVVFSAKAGEKKVEAVSVEAFGKKYDLSKAELELVAGFPLSSLAITHEAGYERTGGHMVHFKLKSGGETALISVTEKKGLKVWKLPKADGETRAK